jgi:hypothetical protein
VPGYQTDQEAYHQNQPDADDIGRSRDRPAEAGWKDDKVQQRPAHQSRQQAGTAAPIQRHQHYHQDH